MQKISELRRKMDEAVLSENFEEAARIRDELKVLAEATEVTE